MSGACAKISRPIVASPASEAGSRTASMYTPVWPSRAPVSMARHHSSVERMSMRVPKRRSLSSFAAGALAGTTAVAVMPRRCAMKATPSALLPVLVV
jgi:hypothetical protein